MQVNPSSLLSLALIGSGALAWAAGSRLLAGEPVMRIPSNPMGVKMSPYGEVFAMAMQGPIDLYWHGGAEHDHDHHGQAEGHDHDHEDEVPNEIREAASPRATARTGNAFRDLLNELNEVAGTRTNPRAATKEHVFDMRRRIEDKLRFAYELDPSHYGNYNSYHFFLTQPQLGTRPELTEGAARLAESTIRYCLLRDDDPRPALTAAAAAGNELELMFAEPSKFTTKAMRDRLSIFNLSLARHHEISRRWIDDGNWNLISPMRQEEITNRYKFLSRVRDAAESTILRLEGKPTSTQAAN